jgi:hypothetical protein
MPCASSITVLWPSRTAEEFKVERAVINLQGMAEATVQIFFKQHPAGGDA